MPAQTETLLVPKDPAEQPEDQRAIHLPTFLNRILPYYTQPAWLEAERWRAFVRNQSIAIITRDTLISNMLNMDWDIVPRDADEARDTKMKKAIDYYKELFTYLEGDFDIYLELMLQDLLDLPFGAAAEVGRVDDEPGAPVLWVEHIDAATLFPTGNPDYPVAQQVPDVPGVQVVFPEHAISRMYMTPRPELRIKGWGMAPPQKVYLAIEMLFRGDHYYWKLLLDTPEAGIIDLIDMSEDAARKWLTGFRDIFQGIDGFKIPILYGHDTPAQWIPLNRPPIDMMYDKTYMKYAQITAAAYGLRLSDIGLAEVEGEKSLAGVIRGERQSKRTGRALVKAKTSNHFNWLLPPELKFVWKDADDEAVAAKGTAMQAMTGGLKTAMDGGFIDQAEGRAELVASGIFETELDPKKVPEKPEPPPSPFGTQPPPGQAEGVPQEDQKVPVDQGGRGSNPFQRKAKVVERQTEPRENPVISDQGSVLERMEQIIRPGLETIRNNAQDPMLRRLIKAATKEMFADIALTLRSLSQDQVEEIWLPQMQLATFDEPSEVESALIRRGIEEAKDALERSLASDNWWSMLSILDKDAIVRLYIEAYENGMEEMALDIVRSLYEEGLATAPVFAPAISFNLVNNSVLGILERSAAQLVTYVDSGTKFFLKRMIVAGVRQGLSSQKIAAAIRDGDAAEHILRREDFLDDVSGIIRRGLIEMTEHRANSIVNTEINRAENIGKLDQLKRSGFTQKRWVHLGPRGITAAGNLHPCPICEGNEELEWVPADFLFDTVFKNGGEDGEGRQQTPPGHPTVCHCTVTFPEDELGKLIVEGKYTPWKGD